MRTRKIIVLGIAGLLFMFCAMAEQNVPNDAGKAATQGLKAFLDKIPKEFLGQFGFDNDDALESASLGSPFLVHTLTPSALASYQPGIAVPSLMTPTTMVYFPIIIAGRAKAILVVDRLDNQWQAVSLGYPGLARELDAVHHQWNERQGYHPILITVFQAQQHLFTVPEKGSENLTPLTPAKYTASTDQQQAIKSMNRYATLENASDVIPSLKPLVADNIRNSKP